MSLKYRSPKAPIDATVTDEEYPPLSRSVLASSSKRAPKQAYTKPSKEAVTSSESPTIAPQQPDTKFSTSSESPFIAPQQPDAKSSTDAVASSESPPITPQQPHTMSSTGDATSSESHLLTQQPAVSSMDTTASSESPPVTQPPTMSLKDAPASSDFPPLSAQKSPTTSSTNATASSNLPPPTSKPRSYAAASWDKSSDKSSTRAPHGRGRPPSSGHDQSGSQPLDVSSPYTRVRPSSDAQDQPGAQPLTMSSTRARHRRGRPSGNAQDHGSVQPQGNIKLSKAMSWLLRHGAKEEGIQIGEDGFVRVKDLLSHPRFSRYKFEDVEREVLSNDKQRYSLVKKDVEGSMEWLIRANQGHSLKVDAVEMTQITSADDIPVAIHGTYSESLSSIKKDGLSRMSRNHIHFAAGMLGDEGVISGMRKTCDVFIYADVAKAMEDGIKFYRSTNNVILTEGQNGVLEAKYFKKIVDRDGKEISKASG